jgi:hypothetical protein
MELFNAIHIHTHIHAYIHTYIQGGRGSAAWGSHGRSTQVLFLASNPCTIYMHAYICACACVCVYVCVCVILGAVLSFQLFECLHGIQVSSFSIHEHKLSTHACIHMHLLYQNFGTFMSRSTAIYIHTLPFIHQVCVHLWHKHNDSCAENHNFPEQACQSHSRIFLFHRSSSYCCSMYVCMYVFTVHSSLFYTCMYIWYSVFKPILSY